MNQLFDIAVIGAGISGLTCAKQLQQQGYKVIILEKSRGLGGRLATRRVEQTCVDHGLSYFFQQGNQTQQLIDTLTKKQIIKPITPNIYQWHQTLELTSSQTYYTVPQGITAIAKYLAESLTIWRQHRVVNLTPSQDNIWHITCEAPSDKPKTLLAKKIVSAIPAPQLHLLLNSSNLTQLNPSFLETLNQVNYDPCLTVMAGYHDFNRSDLIWDQVKILGDSDLKWIGLESAKRDTPNQVIFVFHSTPNYAVKFLGQSNLKPIGQFLLNQAEKLLSTPFKNPTWFQVHSWRYAIPRQSLPLSCLSTDSPLPLIACGDWCEGQLKSDPSWYLEKAIASGLAAANKVQE